ncbi:hypothetical protein GPECTOR_83g280 [Gonium pectorale]|uniref:Lipoprotein n=1 Tax=Gonium pectorale TaxID=33097 RepID=A0A150G1F0_GONPE|nr:hypothetical protein GPECTOR_83g280 [Gonium pectorale]|eukprot:KXZ43668.1 hypothetical protein GPECTOR_83g280 [Gonium pectorale]
MKRYKLGLLSIFGCALAASCTPSSAALVSAYLGLWPQPQIQSLSSELVPLDVTGLSATCRPQPCGEALRAAADRVSGGPLRGMADAGGMARRGRVSGGTLRGMADAGGMAQRGRVSGGTLRGMADAGGMARRGRVSGGTLRGMADAGGMAQRGRV